MLTLTHNFLSLSFSRARSLALYVIASSPPTPHHTPPSPSAESADNPDGEFLRFEFLECLVRLSIIKFGGGEVTHTLPPHKCFERAVVDYVLPKCADIDGWVGGLVGRWVSG